MKNEIIILKDKEAFINKIKVELPDLKIEEIGRGEIIVKKKVNKFLDFCDISCWLLQVLYNKEDKQYYIYFNVNDFRKLKDSEKINKLISLIEQEK